MKTFWIIWFFVNVALAAFNTWLITQGRHQTPWLVVNICTALFCLVMLAVAD